MYAKSDNDNYRIIKYILDALKCIRQSRIFVIIYYRIYILDSIVEKYKYIKTKNILYVQYEKYLKYYNNVSVSSVISFRDSEKRYDSISEILKFDEPP